MKEIKGLSLFACTGVGEYLLNENNINIVVANELLKNRADFYRNNYPESDMITGDITDKNVFNKILESSKEKDVEFIIASPPCQGFSRAGKMNQDDPRNKLIFEVFNMINGLNPKFVIIENVPEFIKSYFLYQGKEVLITELITKLYGNNYNIEYDVKDASDYDTPQNRKRSFVLMSRKDTFHWNFPEYKLEKITVEEAISHLPSLESGEDSGIPYHKAKKHNDRHILFMKHTPSGKTAFNNEIYYPKKEDGTRIKGFKTTYKRMSWDRPAPTITMANGSVSSQNNVHPGRLLENGTYSDARVLTLLELIILTGLDENWKIPDNASKNLVRIALGECIPPKLIFHLTKPIKNYLKNI